MTYLKKMLIVDDSRVSRMMSSTFLKKLRPEVEIVEAADADSALSALSQTPIDMCIIDFNMPGMDGLELAQEIKNQRSEARIALLTANVQDSVKERAEAIGVSFFRKPITESVITKILDELAPAA
ncbi:MAG: response regulator [Nitrosomonas sp.]|nr:response regulator [Nitrosomonas sp.]